jgi:hypothetical protein
MARLLVALLAGTSVVATAIACNNYGEQGTAPDPGTDANADPITPPDASEGSTASGSFVVSTLTNQIPVPDELAFAGSDLLVTSEDDSKGGIYRIPKAGGGAPVVFVSGSTTNVAVSGSTVFYCNPDGMIFSIPLGGGAVRPWTNMGCADLAAFGDVVAFTTGGNNWVGRFSDLDDAGAYTAAGGLGSSNGVVIDSTGIYYSESGGGAIGRVTLLSNTDSELTDQAPGAGPIAIDAEYVYWIATDNPKVRRIKKDGTGTVSEVSTSPQNPQWGSIAVDATHVWWTVADDTNGGLYRAPKAGGPAEAVATNLHVPAGVVLDDQYAYVAVQNDDSVIRVTKTRQ